jgi:hypothetical protein
MAKYWFRQKSIGYGATPNTWQGWAVTLVGVVLIFGVVIESLQITDQTQRFLFALPGIALVSLAMSVIAWLKTEGGWRWRSGKDDN